MPDPDYLRQTLLLGLALLLVALTGFFVAAEFALVKIRATRVEELATGNVFGARKVQAALRDLNGYLSACQLGITICTLVLGSFGEQVLEGLLHKPLHTLPSWGKTAVALTLVTIVEVVVGEMAPKSVAIQKAEKVTLACIYPLDLFYRLFRLPIVFMTWLAALVLRPFGMKPSVEHGSGDAHSEDELRLILEHSAKGGAIDEEEADMAARVFDFAHRTAREVMIPRPDVTYLHADKTVAENLALADAAGHSRFPVIENGSSDKIVGMVHAKDLLRVVRAGIDDQKPLRTAIALRELSAVPETKPIDELVRELQRRRQRMVVVADEYGGTAGIITLEDIVEEVFGDFHDEFDRDDPEMEPLGKDCWTVDARMNLDKLRRVLEIAAPGDEDAPEVDTVGGWVLAVGGGVTSVGQSVPYNDATFTVEELSGRRIRRVRVCLPERETEESDAAPRHDPA